MAGAAQPDTPVTARALPDLLDGVPIGVFLTDEDLRLVWANPRVGELTGVRIEDATGRSLPEDDGGRVDLLTRRVAIVLHLAEISDERQSERFLRCEQGPALRGSIRVTRRPMHPLK